MRDKDTESAGRRCANPACRRRDIRARGRCQACYVFLRRHGRDVRREEMRPARRQEVPCDNCRRRPVRAQGRCRTCYQYWRRTGRERPVTPLIEAQEDGLCGVCGQRRVYRQHRCRSCYAYLQKHGKDRSLQNGSAWQ